MTFRDAGILLLTAVVFFIGGHFLWTRPASVRDVVTVRIDSTLVDSLTVVAKELQAKATTVNTQLVFEKGKRLRAEKLYASLLAQITMPGTGWVEWPATSYDTTITKIDAVKLIAKDSSEVTIPVVRTVRMWGTYQFPPLDKFVDIGAELKPYTMYFNIPEHTIYSEVVQKVWAWEPIAGAVLAAVIVTLLAVK